MKVSKYIKRNKNTWALCGFLLVAVFQAQASFKADEGRLDAWKVLEVLSFRGDGLYWILFPGFASGFVFCVLGVALLLIGLLEIKRN